MNSLELSPPVFSILSSLIEEKVGLHYGLQDRDLLRDKASGRAQEAGFSTLLDYYYYLRYDANSDRELAELVEALVVNETYFFREWPAIKTLVDLFIAPMVAKGRRPRVWSAACASGEEPLSLAMLLEERGLLAAIDLDATDISARVLSRAQKGRYGRRAIRSFHEPTLVERYLTNEPDGYSVAQHLMAKIQWRRQNLLADTQGWAEVYDVVICRNVLIYFAEPTVRRVLRNLSTAMVPGGLLLVGVSESLLRYGSEFQVEEHDGCFIYRKPYSQ